MLFSSFLTSLCAFLLLVANAGIADQCDIGKHLRMSSVSVASVVKSELDFEDLDAAEQRTYASPRFVP